jgi:hypothetical protein
MRCDQTAAVPAAGKIPRGSLYEDVPAARTNMGRKSANDKRLHGRYTAQPFARLSPNDPPKGFCLARIMCRQFDLSSLSGIHRLDITSKKQRRTNEFLSVSYFVAGAGRHAKFEDKQKRVTPTTCAVFGRPDLRPSSRPVTVGTVGSAHRPNQFSLKKLWLKRSLIISSSDILVTGAATCCA